MSNEFTTSDPTPPDSATNDSSAARLKSLIERIERLSEEKDAIAHDIREVLSEAKGTGFDVRTMRTILKMRKMEAADRAEQQELVELYGRALEMTI